METLTLTELGHRMAARWRALVVAAVVGLGLGTAAAAVLPVRYEAVAVVRVDAADPGRVDMAAEEALASSRRVTAEALDALGERSLTIEQLEGAASAATVKASRVLHVRYAAASPADAARGADAVANAYLAVRSVDAGRPRDRDPSAVAVEVVDPARTPTSPVGPSAAATALAGLGLGLLVGAPVAARPSRSPAAPAS